MDEIRDIQCEEVVSDNIQQDATHEDELFPPDVLVMMGDA